MTKNRLKTSQSKEPPPQKDIYIYISLHVKDSAYLFVIAALKFSFFFFVIINVNEKMMQFSSEFWIYKMSGKSDELL